MIDMGNNGTIDMYALVYAWYDANNSDGLYTEIIGIYPDQESAKAAMRKMIAMDLDGDEDLQGYVWKETDTEWQYDNCGDNKSYRIMEVRV